LELQRQKQAKKEEERARQSIPDFADWLPLVTPEWTWDWDYQEYIQERLRWVTNRKIKRLMINIPPRHGKSEMVTVRYPVWNLEKDPTTKVIIGAHSQTLADKFSRKARKIIQAKCRTQLSGERSAVQEWETSRGGGCRVVGVGGGITGMGGDIIIIDDPVKNREEANSEAYRRRVWNWYKDDLYTRLAPGGVIILIMTRWHEDDLAGRILRSDQASDWVVISLPAIAEVNDPLGRAIGEALCPERYPIDDLLDKKATLLNSFYALYQQMPQPPEGGLFKREWYTIVPSFPHNAQYFVRYWDEGATKDAGDYTAGVLMAYAYGTYYVVDVARGQWDTDERDQIIRQTAALDRTKYGADTQVWVEREGGSSGKSAARAFVRMLLGYPAFSEYVTGSKELRAEPFRSQSAVNNVKLVEGTWNEAWLSEFAAFPTGTNDDQVDATSGAFRRVQILSELGQDDEEITEAPAAGDSRYVGGNTTLRGRL
jgi:predicted phage terminase large subunit-like protein